MGSLAIAAWLVVAPTRVGVTWHDQATVEPATQQRLGAAISDALGIPPQTVLQDALVEARRREAYRLSGDEAREISDLQARVELAVALFRAGDLEAAAAQTDLVLERLRQRPGLPLASSIARRLRVLQGRIAWTQADDAATEEAWRAAIALDPQARLSGREAPPDVIASFESTREKVLAERPQWRSPTFEGASIVGAEVEIDGVGGMRPVPPGEHFIVVHWPGAAPQAKVVRTGAAVLAAPEVTVPDGLPTTPAAAQVVCDRLDLELLVLARVRDGRLGVQGYACGSGVFGEVWYSEAPVESAVDLAGLVEAAWGPASFERDRSVLLDAKPWPRPEPPSPGTATDPATRPEGPGRGTEDGPPRKPWFRRPWVWVVAGVVVAGAVTTGVVLGTRDTTSSVVVTDDFLRP